MREIDEERYMTPAQFFKNVRNIFKDTLIDFKNSINDDEHVIKIGFITDTHYVIRDRGYFGGKSKTPGMAYRNRSHLYNIGFLSDKLDFIVHGGDVVDGNEKTSDVYNQLVRDVGTLFSTISCPHSMVIGNHDNNSNISTKNAGNYRKQGYEFTVLPSLLNQYFISDPRIHKTSNRNYWFYDIKGIRIIGLDLFFQFLHLDNQGYLKYPAFTTSVIDQVQINWLIEVLTTSMPIIIFSHCPIAGIVYQNTVETTINHHLIVDILKAKQRGLKGTIMSSHIDFPVNVTYDFSKTKGNLISLVNGHVHSESVKQWEGINIFSGLNSLGVDKNHNVYWDTEYEDAFYVLEIDSESRKVNIRGYGRGSNSYFYYR